MSEDLHNIDDLFKKAIDEHEDSPSAAVWEAIDKNLDKKKVVSISKKYNTLKWAAAVLLLFSFGMAMYTWQTRMKNKELVKQNNINKASKTHKENSSPNEKKSTLNTKTNTEENNNKSLSEKQLDKTQVQANTDINTAKDQQQNSSQQKITAPGKEKYQPTNPSQQDITVRDKEKIEKEQTTNRNENPNPVNDHKQQKNNDVILQDNMKTKVPENSITTPEKYIADAPIIFKREPNLNSILEIQSSNPFSYKPDLVVTDNVVTEKKKTTASKKNTSRSPNNSLFAATVFFSPEFVSSDVKDDHPRFREDNHNDIKNNEKIRSSSSYGVLFSYAIGKSVQLQSGVAISTRVTDINTKTIYARPDNNGNVNYRLSCSAGSVYVPLKSGATPAQGDSTKILSAKNTLQYISIPLSVKYTIGKGKFNIVPGVGIAANILSKGKVETILATTSGNESSSIDNINGLKSNYFSGHLSLGAEYYISKKIAFNFTPTAKVALSSINKDAAVKTKLNSFGLSAGITIKL